PALEGAARHGGQDHHGVRVRGARLQAVEHTDVLVVEVDVDVTVELALWREELVLRRRIALGQSPKRVPHRGAVDAYLGLSVGVRAQHWRDLDRRHGRET